MRALGFEAKKTDVLKILKDYDHQSTGKIVFSDFQDVSEYQLPGLFTCLYRSNSLFYNLYHSKGGIIFSRVCL